MIQLDHIPDSLNLSPCEFWLFGVLKVWIKENVCRNVDEAEEFVCNLWIDATFKEGQLMFHEKMKRFESVCGHDRNHVPE
jgi:hypothetical protein